MAHELDFNEATGGLAYAGRLAGWHDEGVVWGEDADVDLDRALRDGGLAWRVEKVPLFYEREKTVRRGFFPDRTVVEHEAADGCYGILRVDRSEILGQVTDAYEPLQNEEAFAVFEPLLETGEVDIETAGSIRGGRDVWMLGRLDRHRMIDRVNEMLYEDPDATGIPEIVELPTTAAVEAAFSEIAPYLLVTNNHAGTRAVLAKNVDVRVVCANTLGIALREGGISVEAAHRKNVREAVAAGTKLLLDSLVARFARSAAWRDLFLSTILDDRAFEGLVLEPSVPIAHLERKVQRGTATGHTKRAIETADEKRDEIRRLWTEGAGHTGEPNAWWAYNGLVEAVDHDPAWDPRDGSRVRSNIDGVHGRVKGEVHSRLFSYATSDEEQREAMLA